MGKENHQPTGIETEGSGTTKNRASQPSADTQPTRNRKRGGRGAGGSTEAAGSTEKEKSVEFHLVETPEIDDKEAERRKKRAEAQRARRQSKKEQKEGSPASVKPKTKADPTQIAILLSTVSLFASTREGMEHWALTDSEIKQIAQPLANILSKYEAVANISTEYADHMALIMAGAMIIFPRVMMSLKIKKNNPKQPKEVKVNARSDQHKRNTSDGRDTSTGETEASRGTSPGNHAPSTTNVNAALSQLLPATGSF